MLGSLTLLICFWLRTPLASAADKRVDEVNSWRGMTSTGSSFELAFDVALLLGTGFF